MDPYSWRTTSRMDIPSLVHVLLLVLLSVMNWQQANAMRIGPAAPQVGSTAIVFPVTTNTTKRSRRRGYAAVFLPHRTGIRQFTRRQKRVRFWC
ncbi:hypothetical protein IW262DRAFT_217273 [Armillaria fumosa]|nr:hypothetical protein IW262DRAFT_217273 [Armillaria fumosa]